MGVRSGRLEQWVEMLVRTQAWKSLPRSGFVQLHLLAIIFATQASMKNQEVMMTQFQRFLATLSSVASRRVLQDGFANKLADYQVVVLTGVNLPQMVLQ
jgi:hypothetical protein